MRPLYVDISGTLDSKGNGTFPVRVPRMTGNWHNAKLNMSTSAPARWTALVNGRPHDFRPGTQAVLGPVLVQDGETVAVQVTGGSPGGTVDGTCTGVSGEPDKILASFTPSPGAIAVDTLSTRQALTPTPGQPSLSVGTNTNGQVVLQLQTGTQAIALLVDVPGNITGINLIGNVTGQDYAANIVTAGASLGNQQQFRFPIESAWDTAVTLKITTNANGGATAWASAVLDPEVTWQASQEPVGAQVLAYNQRQIGYEDATTPGGTLGGSLLTSMVKSHPALWQAPAHDVGISDATGTSPATVVAAVAGQVIRVWSWKLEAGTVGATRFLGLRGSSRTTFDGTFASAWLGSMTDRNGNAGGIPLPVGDALVLDTTAINGETVRAAVGYSQG